MTAGHLDVFYGEANNVQAHMYLRWSGNAVGLRDVYLEGPFCQYANTLPVKLRFEEMESNDTSTLMKTVLPDPCCWTPELPFIYHVTADVAGQEIVRSVGLRTLGAAGRDLIYDGRRYVAVVLLESPTNSTQGVLASLIVRLDDLVFRPPTAIAIDR